MRTALYAIGILVGALVVGALLVDEGEVVTLETRNGEGAPFETPLWIVEAAGAQYLRASSPESDWLARVRTHPRVEIQRGEERESWVASPDGDPAVRRDVNAAMAAKYRWSDRLLGLLFEADEMVPVRLERAEEDLARGGPGIRHGSTE